MSIRKISLPRKNHDDDIEMDTLRSALVKRSHRRDQVKLLVRELETNSVDSPHHFD
jgi:hypothetical protein